MDIDIITDNIVLHYKLSCIHEKLQHYKGVKIQKKNKKNRERVDVYGCIGIGGGGVYLQHIATLVWFVVGGFGKGDTRQSRLGDTLQR